MTAPACTAIEKLTAKELRSYLIDTYGECRHRAGDMIKAARAVCSEFDLSVPSYLKEPESSGAAFPPAELILIAHVIGERPWSGEMVGLTSYGFATEKGRDAKDRFVEIYESYGRKRKAA